MRARLSKALLWLSAVDPEVLAKCPTERWKFVTTGGIVLNAAGLGVLAATFTLRDFLRAPIVVAIIFGLCWGVAIMNIDRWLLASIRRQRTTLLTLAMAIPRLFLAVIVGLVVAQPLVLTVFRSEINRQVHRDKGEELSNEKRHLEAQYARIQTLSNERETLQKDLTAVTTDASLAKNSRYQELNGILSTLERQERRAENKATCELEGSCGTKRFGHGPVYERKREIAKRISNHIAEVKSQREALASEITGQERSAAREQRRLASPRLIKIGRELDTLEGERREEERQYAHESKAHAGLLDRIEALNRLSEKEPGLRATEVLFWLLILAFDTMPAFAKTIMSLGRLSPYEQALDIAEKDAIAAAEAKHKANIGTYTIEAETQIKAAEVRRDLEILARTELTEKMVNAQKKAAETFVNAWETTVVPLAEEWADEWAKEFKEASEERTRSRSMKDRHTPGWKDLHPDWREERAKTRMRS